MIMQCFDAIPCRSTGKPKAVNLCGEATLLFYWLIMWLTSAVKVAQFFRRGGSNSPERMLILDRIIQTDAQFGQKYSVLELTHQYHV